MKRRCVKIDISKIKRKLLVKYPTFGSVIANLVFKEENEIPTAGTDGKTVYYNSEFLDSLTEKQQLFIFAHEICHVAFEHMYRCENRNQRLWNLATDGVINALLVQDGLDMIKGGIKIADAEKYDSEELYDLLLKEIKENEEENEEHHKDSKENSDVGHDTHKMWGQEKKESKEEQNSTNSTNQQQENDMQESNTEEQDDFSKKGEKEVFEQNREERSKRLERLGKRLAEESTHHEKNEEQTGGRKLSDIGIAVPLIDWRRVLKQAFKYNEEWTRKNVRMRNGYFRHKVKQFPILETEILLDVSGSVSETLLKNFLRECKNIIENSRVKVGCFDTEFYGFRELRSAEDIDKMTFPKGGGTDFNVAIDAFSNDATNKIIFTDGEAQAPKNDAYNVIWVVFGNRKINPKGGKVIYINGDQLKKLQYSYRDRNKTK